MHDFFADWFNGVLDDTVAAFARVAEVLHADFAMVTTSGEILGRAVVLEQLRRAHASADVTAPIRIDILNVVDRVIGVDSALLSYEEWQFAADRMQSGRMSTAYFVRAAAAPHGVVWRHLHETLLTSG